MLWPKLDTDTAALAWLKRQPFAHRGLHNAAMGIPENSWAAFDRAVEAGVGIELDIQITRDGDVVVLHDSTLDRMTGVRGPVNQRGRDEIRKLKLLGTDEGIHTLHDTLIRVRGRVPVLIEAKVPPKQDYAPICFAIRRALEGYRGECAVMSFNHKLVGWFYRHHPKVQRGLVMTEAERGAALSRYDIRRRLKRQHAVRHAHPMFIAYDVAKLPSPFIEEAREKDRPVLAWTVRSNAERKVAAQYADQMIFEDTRGPKPA